MQGLRSARGESKLGTIFFLLIVVFVIYETFKFGPLIFAQYEFEDTMISEAKFSARKDASAIQDSLANQADALGVVQDVAPYRRPVE